MKVVLLQDIHTSKTTSIFLTFVRRGKGGWIGNRQRSRHDELVDDTD